MQYKKTVVSFVVLLFLSVEGASCFLNQSMSKQEWSRAIKAMNAKCDACEQCLNNALAQGDFDGAQKALFALQEMMNPLLARRPLESVQQTAAEERLQSLTQQYQVAAQQKAHALEEGIWEMLKRGRLQEADDALNALHTLMVWHSVQASQFEVLDAKYEESARAYAADWRGMDQFDGVEEILRRGLQSLVKTFKRAFNTQSSYPMRGADEVKALNAIAYQEQERACTNKWLRKRKVDGDEYDPSAALEGRTRRALQPTQEKIDAAAGRIWVDGTYDPIKALEGRTRRATQPTQEEIDTAGRLWVEEKYDYEAALEAKKFVVISNEWEYSQEAQALLARTASYPAWLAVYAALEERLRTKRETLDGEKSQYYSKYSIDPQFFRMTRPAKDGYADPKEFKQACEARQKALVELRNATRNTKPAGRDHLVEECRAFGKKHGLEAGDSMAQKWLW